ncbi:AAA family ATPase [Oceanithermus sp.]
MPLENLRQQLSAVLYGQEEAIDTLLATAVSGGHALLEGLPGLGKTLLARSFAQASGLSFRRIQFTPDLLPADVTGTEVWREGRFEFRPGPLFAQVVLADEINRATPKTQSALLEAMQEGAVTVYGVRYELPRPFLVIATQNPIELEGTYPLPEAQVDRFMSKIEIQPPPHSAWLRLLQESPAEPERTASADDLASAAAASGEIRVASSALEAIVNLARLSAEDGRLRFGISPRGTQAWLALARGFAWLAGRPHVEWADLRRSARPALVHRLFLTEEAAFAGVEPGAILNDLLSKAMPE